MNRRKKSKPKKKAKQKHVGKRSPSISVCMIVKNEENFLPKCLESIRDIADEIIVVDTGSTDRSIEIARSYGAKVYQCPWENDFSRHRNQSIDRATGDWIFVIDADEIIPKRDITRLKEAVERPWADAYRMTTRNYKWEPTEAGIRNTENQYDEENGYPYWVPSTKIRLFRNIPGLRFEGAVHELIEQSIKRMGLKIGNLDVPVLHFGDVLKKRPGDRYLRLAKKKITDLPDSPKALYELAVIQLKANNYEKALQLVERAIAFWQQGHKDEYLDFAQLLGLKGSVLLKLGRYAESAAVFETALSMNPGCHEFANNIGACFEYQGDFDTALSWYQKALEICPDAHLPRTNIEKVKKKMKQHKTLSVCMIVKNESQRLEKAIRSVLPFADEVVVVDTGSQDDTVKIAKRLGAKVGFFEWCDDFAAARNASLEMATCDWVMWLDADDYIPPTEWPKFQLLKSMSLNQAFMFKLQNKGEIKTISYQLRMFPNRPDIRFVFPVHEQVAPAIRKLGLPISKADITIVHTGYSSQDVVRMKNEKYLGLLKRQLKKNPSDSFSRCYLVCVLCSQGKLEKAVQEFEKVLKDDSFKKTWIVTYQGALVHLGREYLRLGKVEEAVRVLEKGLELDEAPTLILVALAEAYNKLNMPDKALKILAECRTDRFISNLPCDIGALRYGLEYERAVAYKKLGRLEESLYACRKAQGIDERFKRQAQNLACEILRELSKQPAGLESLARITKSELAQADDFYEFGNALVRSEKIDAAQEAYEKAINMDKGHVKARRAIARILERRDPQKAIEILREGLAIKPEDPDLLADLVDMFFNMGDWEAIVKLPAAKAILPSRIAARLIGGIHEGMEQEIVDLYHSTGRSLLELERHGIASIWDIARNMDARAKFHLAVACTSIEPCLTEAARVAVDGFLAMDKPSKALAVIENMLSRNPADPTAIELLARCSEKLEIVKNAQTTSPL